MKILLIPFLIILIPLVILFFFLRHLTKAKKISVLLKIALGLVFIAIGIPTTFFAMTISISGMSDKGINCMTGAVAFIPLGFIVNLIGIPLLLALTKGRTKENLEVST
jgi:hypothetical protein